MSEKTVFLVYGYDTYEYPYNPIKVFESEEGACALLAAINDYQHTRPVMPSEECSNEEFEAWNKQYAKWRDSHPAKHAYGHDGFDLMPLQFVESTHDQACPDGGTGGARDRHWHDAA